MPRHDVDPAPKRDGYWLESVPPPPLSNKWRQILRWMIAVMDDDDSDLPFVAGILSYCLSHDGCLTDRQAKYAARIWARLEDDYRHARLDMQFLNRSLDHG